MDKTRFAYFNDGAYVISAAYKVKVLSGERGSSQVVSVKVGFGYCAPGDQFSRVEGRIAALERLATPGLNRTATMTLAPEESLHKMIYRLLPALMADAPIHRAVDFWAIHPGHLIGGN